MFDQTKLFAEQSGGAMAAGLKQQDMNKIFKAEWEGMEVACYEDGLDNILDLFLEQESRRKPAGEQTLPDSKGRHKAKLA